MPDQIGWLTRHAVSNQIGRAGDDHAAHFAETDADQAGVGQLTDADGAVDVFIDQIDQPVAQVEIDPDFRVGQHEIANQRRHMLAPEAGWRRDAQLAAGLDAAKRHGGFGIGQIVEGLLAIFQEGLALEGNGQLARGAQQ